MKKQIYPRPAWAIGQTTRESGLVEDVCDHGVGHPNAAWLEKNDPDGKRALSSHGCCGCCYQKPARGRPPGRSAAGQRRLDRAVKLRGKGKTWDEIGRALGVTRQAVSQLVKRGSATILVAVLLSGGCAPLSYVGSAVSGALAVDREDRIASLEEQVRLLRPENAAGGD